MYVLVNTPTSEVKTFSNAEDLFIYVKGLVPKQSEQKYTIEEVRILVKMFIELEQTKASKASKEKKEAGKYSLEEYDAVIKFCLEDAKEIKDRKSDKDGKEEEEETKKKGELSETVTPDLSKKEEEEENESVFSSDADAFLETLPDVDAYLEELTKKGKEKGIPSWYKLNEKKGLPESVVKTFFPHVSVDEKKKASNGDDEVEEGEHVKEEDMIKSARLFITAKQKKSIGELLLTEADKQKVEKQMDELKELFLTHFIDSRYSKTPNTKEPIAPFDDCLLQMFLMEPEYFMRQCGLPFPSHLQYLVNYDLVKSPFYPKIRVLLCEHACKSQYAYALWKNMYSIFGQLKSLHIASPSELLLHFFQCCAKGVPPSVILSELFLPAFFQKFLDYKEGTYAQSSIVYDKWKEILTNIFSGTTYLNDFLTATNTRHFSREMARLGATTVRRSSGMFYKNFSLREEIIKPVFTSETTVVSLLPGFEQPSGELFGTF